MPTGHMPAPTVLVVTDVGGGLARLAREEHAKSAALLPPNVQRHRTERERFELHALETSRAHLIRQLLRPRKLSDRLRQIRIRLARAGNDPTDPRQHARRKKSVQRSK